MKPQRQLELSNVYKPRSKDQGSVSRQNRDHAYCLARGTPTASSQPDHAYLHLRVIAPRSGAIIGGLFAAKWVHQGKGKGEKKPLYIYRAPENEKLQFL